MKDYIEIIECGVPQIDEYCQDILDGTIPSCDYTYKSVQRFQHDLKRIDDDPSFPYYFEHRAVEHFVNFTETHLTHFQGRFSGKPFILENWQYFVVGQIFGWLHNKKFNGEISIRRFQTANIWIGKKNGKSIMASAIALYFLVHEGNGTEAYGFAMSRNHAKKLSWNTAKMMIENNDDLQGIYKVNNSVANLSIRCDDTQSYFEPYSNKSDSADGINPNLIIFDEVKDLEDFELFETLDAGTATRLSPLTLNISSCGYNTNTVGYELFQDTMKILDGKVKDDRTLAILYTIDEGDDEKWDDLDVWRKANPNFGVSVLESYAEKRITDAKTSVRVKNDVLTKNLNTFGKSTKGWLNIEQWDECEDSSLTIEDVKQHPAIITFDISSKLDLTNVKITFFNGTSVNDVKIYPFDYFYLPEERFDRSDDKRSDKYISQITNWKNSGDLTVSGTSSIDYGVIVDTIIDLYERFNVHYIAYDPWHSDAILKDLKRYGIPEEEFIEYTQAGYKNWDSPLKEIERMIADKRIIHNGNKVQRWCMENVATKENNYESIRAVKINDEQKIDGAITLGMAVGAYLWTDFEKKTEGRRLSPIAQRIIANQEI